MPSLEARAGEVAWLKTETPAEATGFIGHAVPMKDSNPPKSVGLIFWDKDLIKRRGLGRQFDTQWVNAVDGRGEATAVWVDEIRTDTKVLFIASCYISDELLSKWKLPQDGALIVPTEMNDITFLNGGADVWQEIADLLGRGSSVGDAVLASNGHHPLYQYRIVGNANARIAPN